jgi:hemoglobin/transferrin/lactoferrin receptor protein
MEHRAWRGLSIAVGFACACAAAATAQEGADAGADTRAGVGVDLPIDTEADPEQAELPVIVVTAKRREAEALDIARHATVVTADRIVESSGQTTPDALREEAGVWIQKTGMGGGSPFIRGLTGKQVLLLVDGVRLNNSCYRYGPNQYLNTIDPAVLERIEVVRGSGSVLYGSDALGGVVNMITRRRMPFGATDEAGIDVVLAEQYSSASGGSVTRLDVEASLGTASFSVGASYASFGDLRAGSGESPVGIVDIDGAQRPTGYDGTSLDASVRWALSPTQELAVKYLHTNQTDVPRSDRLLQSDRLTTPDLEYHYDPQLQELAIVEYEARDVGPLASLKANVSYNRQLEGRRSKRAAWTYTRLEEDEVGTIGTALQLAFKPARRGVVTAGLDFYRDDVGSWRKRVEDGTGTVTAEATSLFPDGTRYGSFGAYVRDDIAVSEAVSVAVGGRVSAFGIESDLGSNAIVGDTSTYGPFGVVGETYGDVTWGVEGVLRASDEVSWYAGVSRGFRAPNVEDLTVNGDWSSGTDIPNPELEPEESLDCELGVKLAKGDTSLGLCVFHNEYTNLIDRVVIDTVGGTTNLTQKQNIDEAYIRGVEMSWRLSLGAGTWGRGGFFGTAAWTYGQNVTDDEPVSRIPPFHQFVGLRWDGARARSWAEFFVETAGTQDRLAATDLTDVRIPVGGTPGWTTVNVRGGFDLAAQARLTLAMLNLTDERYRVHGSGIDAPGLNAVARLEYRF